MRFVRLEICEVRIPFRFSFRHARAARTEAHALILILTTDSGATGYGEVVPRQYLTGETLSSAREDIRRRWWPALSRLVLPEQAADLDPLWPALAPLYAEADAERKLAGYSGVDIAAVDACGRAWGIAGKRLLATRAAPRPLVAPLGSLAPRHILYASLLFRSLGFRHFKLKIGLERDRERIWATSRALAQRATWLADANGAWEWEEAAAAARLLREAGAAVLEQPLPATPQTPAKTAAQMARLQSESGLVIMADESLCTLAEARALLETNVGMWNLRLAKIGGFSGMRAMLALAAAASRPPALYLGVLVGETSLLAAGQRACLGMAHWQQVEYGFPRILLHGDPFRGGPGGYLGMAQPLGNAPGLGVRLSASLLDRVIVSREVCTC